MMTSLKLKCQQSNDCIAIFLNKLAILIAHTSLQSVLTFRNCVQNTN